MFENLSNRLTSSLKRLTGASKLTESNIEEVVSEVRVAILEADVALEVVEGFLSSVKRRALGFSVAEALDVHQTFVKIVHEVIIVASAGISAIFSVKMYSDMGDIISIRKKVLEASYVLKIEPPTNKELDLMGFGQDNILVFRDILED